MAQTVERETWTTWEELLLACAVKRHGPKNWDSVAMELRKRTSPSNLLTPQNCRNKYQDLKRRFIDSSDHDEGDGSKIDDVVDVMPWLEELRKLRVAELKQEVHRYDLSIQSLQMKVKRLEEERERNENSDEKPDLDAQLEVDRSGNGKNDGDGVPEAELLVQVSVRSAPGEDSDGDNRSSNESNSTANREMRVKEGKELTEPVDSGTVKPDPGLSDLKPVGEYSYNDSSDTIAKHAPPKTKPSEEKKVGNSAELRDSAAESKEATKENSDVQSTASLTGKRGSTRERRCRGSGGDEPVVSPATTKWESVKSEPLAGFLDIIRSHKHGSMFQCRLEDQKTDEYRSMVRQHVDLETVQGRLEDGCYNSCAAKFYRDLLLIFQNAVVFFPKGSLQSVGAGELRDVVLREREMKITSTAHGSGSDPPPEEQALSNPLPVQPKCDPERSDILLSLPKSASPIVVCRKRSSTSAKIANTSSKQEKQGDANRIRNATPKPSGKYVDEEEGKETRMRTKERTVREARSLRLKEDKNGANSKANDTVEKAETAKPEKLKRAEAAEFLRRIKMNSQSQGKKKASENLSITRKDGNGGGGRKEEKKRGDGRKYEAGAAGRQSRSGGKKVVKAESRPSKRSVGRPPKKRGREDGEKEAATRRPKKRSGR